MRNTIIVNLFGGPCMGKSTCAAYIFALLKMQGVEVELCTEWVKDKVFEDNKKVFNNQFYITGKQSWKISRLFGETDVIVNDCPILNGCVYTDKPYLKSAIVEEFMSYGSSNINIMLKRVHDYNENGRLQTEDEAIEIDKKLVDILHLKDIESDYEEIPYFEVESSQDGANQITELVLKILNNLKQEDTEQC